MSNRTGLPSGSGRFWKYLAAAFALLLLGPTLLGGVGSWAGARFADLVLGSEHGNREEDLRSQIVELMMENATLREDAMKTERYRVLLGMTRVSSRVAIGGRVLYRTEGLVSGTMVVDRGSRDGVSVNAVCLAPAGLVGIVTSCGEGTCEVLPLISPQVRVSCITRPSGALGILEYQNGELRMLHIDPAQSAASGDEVVTSRFGGVYPDGLLVGHVSRVDTSGTSIALALTVEPSVDIGSISEVLILLNDREELGEVE